MALFEVKYLTCSRKIVTADNIKQAAELAQAHCNKDTVKLLSVYSVPELMKLAEEETRRAG
jgi:hypothetical protein